MNRVGRLVLAAAAFAARVVAADDCLSDAAARTVALSSLERAAVAADGRGDARCAAGLWHRLSRRRLEAGAHDAALADAERGLASARATGDRVLEAQALGDRGNGHFYRLDRPAARRDFEGALARLEHVEEPVPPRLRVALEQDLGITLSNSGEKDLALLHLHRAVEIAERELPGGAWPPLWSNLGSVYEGLDAAPLALDAYERALAAAGASGDPRHLHDARTRIGMLMRAAGHTAEGRAELEAALELSARFPPPAGRVERGWTLGYLAGVRRADGDLAGAESAHREGAALARSVGHGSIEAFHLAGLAELALARDDSEVARAELERAAARLGADDRWPARRIERLRARWERRWGSSAAALEACGRSLDRLERDRDRLAAVEDRRRLLANERDHYQECVELALEVGDRDDDGDTAVARAFAWNARARSPDWRRAGRAGTPVDDRRAPIANALEARLAELSSLDADAPRAALDPRIPGEGDDRLGLEARQIEADQLRRRLARATGAGAEATAEPAPDELAAAIAADAVLVDFALGERSSLAFVVRRGELAAVRIPAGDEELAERIEGFVELLAQDLASGWLPTGRALYRDLVAPLEPHLAGARRLIVIADGPLALLPIEALPVDAPSRPDGSAEALLDRVAVRFALSAAEALADPRMRVPIRAPLGTGASGSASRGALVVADPADAPEAVAPAAGQARRLYALEGLRGGSLPFARREAARLAGRLGAGTVWLERDAADEAAVKRQLRRPLAVAHFATHGFASSWSDRRSALVLRPAVGEDGFLQAREIRALEIDTELVTLAACQSALHRARSGDPTRSLANAFVEAGARTVVAALWELPDRATEVLMRDFYDGLYSGLGRADALREAKLRRRRAGDPPRAWAALVLVGEGDAPLEAAWVRSAGFTERLPLAALVGLAVLAAVGTLGAWRLRTR